jgi:hypothetical protein
VSPQHQALASNPRLAHGARHLRSRFHQFGPVRLLFKWLNGSVKDHLDQR